MIWIIAGTLFVLVFSQHWYAPEGSREYKRLEQEEKDRKEDIKLRVRRQMDLEDALMDVACSLDPEKLSTEQLRKIDEAYSKVGFMTVEMLSIRKTLRKRNPPAPEIKAEVKDYEVKP